MESIDYYWHVFLGLSVPPLLSFFENLPDLTLPVLEILAVLAGLHALEYIVPWRPDQPKWRPMLGVDLLWVAFNRILMPALFIAALIETSFVIFNHLLYRFTGLLDIQFVQIETWPVPLWLGALIFVVFDDFLAYSGHWLLHRSDFLWQFHKVHHSSTQLDAWNAQRFHFGELIFWSYFKFLPLRIVGFPLEHIVVFAIIGNVVSNFTHANVKIPLGPLRYVFNNPQMHIWHHAKTIDTQRNCNYGDVFSTWDFLFGTAYLPEEQPYVEIGFDDVETYPKTFLGQMAAPFVGIYHGIRRRRDAPA